MKGGERMNPFEIKDCALLRRMSGLPPAVNLRELRERIVACSPDVLYHHFCDTQLAPSSDYPDYISPTEHGRVGLTNLLDPLSYGR